MNASDLLVLMLQTGFVLLLVLAIGLMARRVPALQSLIYRLGIVAVLALVIASPWLRERPSPVVPVAWVSTTLSVAVSQPTPTPLAEVNSSVMHVPSAVPATIQVMDWLAGIWLVGVLLLSAHLALGYLTLVRIRRSCRFIDDAAVQEVLSAAARDAKKTSPQLMEGPTVSNPFVAGILTPTIYLPANWHRQVDPDVLEAVLRHEIAHLAHNDLGWKLLHRICCIAFWPQLLLWMLRKPMSTASEQLCDRHVLASGIPDTRYAECLLNLRESARSQLCPSWGIGAVSSKSSLARRVEAILDGKRSRSVVVSRPVSVGLRACALFTAATATLLFARPAAISQDPYANWIMGSHAGKIGVLSPEGKPLTGASAWLVTTGDVPEPRSRRLKVIGSDVILPASGSPERTTGTLAVRVPGYGLGFTRLWPVERETQSMRLTNAVTATGRLLLPSGKAAAGIDVRARLLLGVEREPGFMQFLLLETISELRLGDVTDSEGRFIIRDLPPETKVGYEVDDARFAQLPLEAQIDTAKNGGRAHKDIRLQPAAQLRGRVTRDGKPVAGFKVGAQTNHDKDPDNQGSQGGLGVTDSQGRFTIKRMSTGVYNVIADLRGPMGREVTAVAHESVTVGKGQTIESLDFKLIPGVIVEGIVTDSSGKPVKEVSIGIYGPAHPRSSAWVQLALTDARGFYRMRVPPGKQYVYVSDASFESTPKDVIVRDGVVLRVNFEVRPAPPQKHE